MSKTKKLRFASLIRVSTEKQEKQGESLRTQATDVKQAAKQLSGTVVAKYGGQEHATPGWEKKEIDRLLSNARKREKPFDAIIVAHADRWSRDNDKSAEGLNVFSSHGIRFFVGVTEYNLFDPTHLLFLEMSAVIGKFHARNQSFKSMANRIHRARRLNAPTCGKRPFGRIWHADEERWSVDEGSLAMIRDVAERYLAGEALPLLAEEYGVNHSNLHKTLMLRCGSDWVLTFRSKEFNINERVTIQVPPLLPDTMIRAVRQRAEANKTYSHGHITHRYLLNRMVVCGTCGHALSGQTNANGHRYYRHSGKNGSAGCPLRPRPWVPADQLEHAVLESLFDLLGNPKAMERALAEAIPNGKEADKLRKRQERLSQQLDKLDKGRSKVVQLLGKGLISEDECDQELTELGSHRLRLADELEQIEIRLANRMSPSDVKQLAYRTRKDGGVRVSAKFAASIRKSQRPESLNWDDARALVEDCVGGRLPDGRRMCIQVYPVADDEGKRRKRWRWGLLGKVEIAGVARPDSVTSFAWH